MKLHRSFRNPRGSVPPRRRARGWHAGSAKGAGKTCGLATAAGGRDLSHCENAGSLHVSIAFPERKQEGKGPLLQRGRAIVPALPMAFPGGIPALCRQFEEAWGRRMADMLFKPQKGHCPLFSILALLREPPLNSLHVARHLAHGKPFADLCALLELTLHGNG